jgi:hypothetical protein
MCEEGNSKVFRKSVDHPASEDAKFIHKTKFPSKVLLWLAISDYSLSEPVLFKSGLAVNEELYISKCLPVLLKFIPKHKKK